MELERARMLELILDSLPYPVVFVDTGHVIRYLNRAARYHYYCERGYDDLVGKSLFACHGEQSRKKIEQMVEKLKDHAGEMLVKVNARNQRLYLNPVRDEKGQLVGYFERFEMNLQL